MFDHVTITVSDLQVSKAFYEKTFAPLGYKALFGDGETYLGFGDKRPQFWISQAEEDDKTGKGVHIAFTCRTQGLVRAFYEAAIQAGGQDNGTPGLRPEYHEHYYGAFVIDPDGNNIEAVHGNES